MGIFAFRQFSVCDDLAIMKVGTDAVLLGAWAPADSTKTILDIGTGSGVIALMLAQRSPADAQIDAVELQEPDALQAAANVSASPWPGKIKIHQNRIQDFSPGRKYDLIVCNPPFFTNSLLPPSQERSKARHGQTLSPEDLITTTLRLLSPEGILCVIMPPSEGERFIEGAETRRLFLHRMTRFYTRAGKPQERLLMQFGWEAHPPKEDSLFLYTSGSQWTTEYSHLTRDFYLER